MDPASLDPVEGRVIGSLIEKQLTTPQQYPLSLNSLTLACNQSSNRDPVVSYSEADVQAALDGLKAKGLVRFVLPSHGRSVVRYRHVLDERLALDARQLALIGTLLLRGPQTVGELRTRTERMAEFDGLGDVERDLEGLTRHDPPSVRRLERRPGQKEERWAQLLSAPAERAAGVADAEAGAERVPEAEAGEGRPPYRPQGAGGAGGVGVGGFEELRRELTDLRSEMADLRTEMVGIRTELDRLRRELGE